MKIMTIAFIRNIVHDVNFLIADDHYVMCFNFFHSYGNKENGIN